MTTWQGAQIAKWLTDAGFTGDEIVHGVALALAATGGADHYSHNPTSWALTERRGLYALRPQEGVGTNRFDLFDPVQATAALREHYVEQGNRWDWHPAHLSGEALRLEPMVRLMLKQPDPMQPAVDTGGMHGALTRLLGLRNAVLEAGANRGP